MFEPEPSLTYQAEHSDLVRARPLTIHQCKIASAAAPRMVFAALTLGATAGVVLTVAAAVEAQKCQPQCRVSLRKTRNF
jgi:hypothetical protein